MNSLKEMHSEKIHLALTLADIDALYKAAAVMFGRMKYGTISERDFDAAQELKTAMRKLDEAVNS